MPKYNSVDNIPAKVFFDILQSKNYQLLRPKPKEKGLEGVFMEIYEEYFLRVGDKEAIEYIKLFMEVSSLTYKIETIKQVLKFVHTLPSGAMGFKVIADMVVGIFDNLEKHLKIHVDRNITLLDEISRILEVELGYIQNDLNFAQMQLDGMQKNTEEFIFDYYESLVQISASYPYGRALDEKMSLAMYVAERKAALKRIKPQKAA